VPALAFLGEEFAVRAIEFGNTGFYPAFDGAKRAKLSEDMGFDIQGFSENHSRATDCFGEMRDAARATSRIKLAAGPVNFVTRNPGVVAAGILPVQIVSDGRAICGVAAGDSAVAAAGKKPQRIADMERDIGYLKTYLAGAEVDLDGRTSRLEWSDVLTWQPIPIQMACSGPRSIALAARVADRICLGVGSNVDRLAWAMSIIEEQLEAAGRDRNSVRIGIFAPLAITDDRAGGRATIRTRVAAWAHMQSGKGVDLSQQPEILRKVTAQLRDGYDYRFHRPDAPAENPNSAICDEEFGDWMGVGGPATYVLDRLGAMVESGIDFFMTALPMAEREQFAAHVMPALRQLRS
jgi:5,10-methylenetetrahydromethanopterin reductase